MAGSNFVSGSRNGNLDGTAKALSNAFCSGHLVSLSFSTRFKTSLSDSRLTNPADMIA